MNQFIIGYFIIAINIRIHFFPTLTINNAFMDNILSIYQYKIQNHGKSLHTGPLRQGFALNLVSTFRKVTKLIDTIR